MPRGFIRHLRLIAILTALSAAAVGAPGAAASDFFAGYEAFRRGDYDAAHAAWLPLARAGDADAQFNLGALYENGFGVAPDADRAANWYREAATRRLGLAQIALARLRHAGAIDDDVVENPIELLESAARRGSVEAQYELGVAYDRGLGVTQNHATAAGWYQRAAEQGLADAQYNIATLYDEGLGTARDAERAHQWYMRAADTGEPRAMNNLGFLYEKGLNGPQDYGKAILWYRRAARRGLAIAQSNLAALYYLGHGVERDFEQARHWYQAAAEQGDAVGQNGLGLLYANGLGVERDLVQAMAWFALAAESEGPAGADALGYRVRIGNLLSPQEHAEAEALSGEIAARMSATVAAGRTFAGISLPRPADGFGALAIQVQRLLKSLGYYAGAVDGIAGPLTVEAIRRFLHDHGLTMGPRITLELADVLEAARGARAAPSAESAVERQGSER